MPEWLMKSVDEAGVAAEYQVAIMRVALAALAGVFAACIYQFTFGKRRKENRNLNATLVLLSILVSVVTQVIGDNTARAFGLVGALSIVRFRTVVEDTADTAFVIFAVAIGMAVGAGFAILAAICIPFIGVVAWAMSQTEVRRKKRPPQLELSLRVGLGSDPDLLCKEVFAQYLTSQRLSCTNTVKQGAALELTYQVQLKQLGELLDFLNALNKVEGILGVELKQAPTV